MKLPGTLETCCSSIRLPGGEDETFLLVFVRDFRSGGKTNVPLLPFEIGFELCISVHVA